jgi:hypothetical protein
MKPETLFRAAAAVSFGLALSFGFAAAPARAQDYKAVLAAPDRAEADVQNDK